MLLFLLIHVLCVSALIIGSAECASQTTFNDCRQYVGCIWVNGETCQQCSTTSNELSCPQDKLMVYFKSVSEVYTRMDGLGWSDANELSMSSMWTLQFVSDIRGGGYHILNQDGQLLTNNNGYLEYTSSGDATVWCFLSDGNGQYQIMDCQYGVYIMLGETALACMMTAKEQDYRMELSPETNPDLCQPRDSDSCLQASYEWGDDWTCEEAGEKGWCVSDYTKDMHRCCPVTCDSGYLSESACNALPDTGHGSCMYPNAAQPPCAAGAVETTCAQLQNIYELCSDPTNSLYWTMIENCPATCGYKEQFCMLIGCSTESECSVFETDNVPGSSLGKWLMDKGDMSWCDNPTDCCSYQWWKNEGEGPHGSCSEGCDANSHLSEWGHGVCPSTCARECNKGVIADDIVFTLPNMYTTDVQWHTVWTSSDANNPVNVGYEFQMYAGKTSSYTKTYKDTIGAKVTATVSANIGFSDGEESDGMSDSVSTEFSNSFTTAQDSTTGTNEWKEITLTIGPIQAGQCSEIRQIWWMQTDHTQPSLSLITKSPDYCEVECGTPLIDTGKVCNFNKYSPKTSASSAFASFDAEKNDYAVYGLALIGLGVVMYGAGKHYTKGQYTAVVDTAEV